MSNPRLIDPLRRRPFRHLAISYAINELGDCFGIVALSVLVFQRTGSPMATTLLFLGTGFLPAVLTPFFVARLERPPPRFALPAIYAAEAAAFGALALLSEHFSLVAIVLVAALDGALALTAKALTRGVSAEMLEPHGELRAGNAVLNMAFTAGSAGGPALAGLVAAGIGIQSTLLLDAASFYAIAWIVLAAGELPRTRSEAEPDRLREQVKAGLAHIRDNTTLRRLIGAEALALIFFSLAVPIEVVYAKESLGAGDAGYGLLLSSWGIGMVLGGIAFASLRRASLPYLLFFSTIGIGVGYLGMAGAQTLAVACAAAVLGGVGNGVHWVAMISAVQELAARTMQTRTIGTLESIASAAPGIGYVLGGAIAAAWDPRATFAVAGAGVIVVVLVSALLLGRNWPLERGKERPGDVDAADELMVELIPAEALPSLDRRS